MTKNKTKVIKAEAKILQANQNYANQVRELLHKTKTDCLNLISSPGTGKTTLLVETIKRLSGEIRCAVIEGDQQTSNDAKRIAETGIPVVQVNTLQSCHLNASQILESIQGFALNEIDLLFIENVGNLICPASMDLGENEKVVLLSTTEGEDKPEKYPLAFSEAHTMVVTKIDLLPHLRFNLKECENFARQINGKIHIIHTSSFTPEGLNAWNNWLKKRIKKHL